MVLEETVSVTVACLLPQDSVKPEIHDIWAAGMSWGFTPSGAILM